MNVLIVEDDPDVADLLEHHVTHLGHHAWVATSGEGAVGMLDRESWSIVVVDIYLPGLDGRELIHRIRNRPRDRGVAVVATSVMDPSDLARVGADASLPKPFRSVDVVRAFDEALAIAAMRAPGAAGSDG